MAAAEAANCIMEVSAWNAAGGGDRFGGRCFMAWRRGCESADLSEGLQPYGGEPACSGSGPPFQCGLPSFRGPAVSRPDADLVPPSHVEEGWGRFRPGPHVAAARWVGRGCAAPGGPAGSTCGTKAPPPAGGGAPRGGREEALTLLRPPALPEDRDVHFPVGLTRGPPKRSLGRGSVSGPSASPFPGLGHSLRHRSRFCALLG